VLRCGRSRQETHNADTAASPADIAPVHLSAPRQS
jgi:hypothetical protein